MKFYTLIVIENGKLRTYRLGDRESWVIGRPANGNVPDISLDVSTVSRMHGELKNMDGEWFYLDHNGKNGTVCNGKHIAPARNGKNRPIGLNDGDVLIFGGGETAAINSKTVWAMFSSKDCCGSWKMMDTKGLSDLLVRQGNMARELHEPLKGTVVDTGTAIMIYMGDISYIFGNIMLSGRKRPTGAPDASGEQTR